MEWQTANYFKTILKIFNIIHGLLLIFYNKTQVTFKLIKLTKMKNDSNDPKFCM